MVLVLSVFGLFSKSGFSFWRSGPLGQPFEPWGITRRNVSQGGGGGRGAVGAVHGVAFTIWRGAVGPAVRWPTRNRSTRGPLRQRPLAASCARHRSSAGSAGAIGFAR